ncbi:MAG: hypothetical protein KKA55_01535 [Proteobacteria bacterium]|nr:hypothetical protein [Pseudomonadota bacterium]MBU1594202.1 hypothetical protein [Pseudomonadota bacterium]
MKYMERDSFHAVAAMLVEHYMPRSTAKQLEIAEVFRDIYTTWLILAPIANRAQGYWRPWWGPGVVMSWLRVEINRFQRTYLGRIPFDWASAQVAPGAAAAGIQDADFLTTADALLDHAVGDTLRASFTKYVMGGLVWRADGELALAVAREHQAGLMWHEHGLWLLARKPFEADGVAWSDLRETPVDILAWSVKVVEGKLQARMSEPTVRRLKDSVRAAMASDASPEHKLRQINAAVKSFYHWARYAFDARQQATELEAWIWRRVSRHIVQNSPKILAAYLNLRTAAWDTQLHFGRVSYLLDRDVTDEDWLKIWNPRR